ncbi:TM1812 family CRISPR-associated protein [Thermosulfurimonas marina]|uniref:TM1812 family CRISPR-associated protein n=1 Tax=Thermosulfurimonas marina TaxID=2047767 RepID=UPI00144A8751|nr:TM1812 family CRISPR-associated protein [Thermosulfurimonas marina]
MENLPEEQRVAPVFDLTPYALLLEWSFAVEEFLRYGLAERLYELVRGEIAPILKETRGRDLPDALFFCTWWRELF